MIGFSVNAVATFKFTLIKDNLKEDQVWAGNSLRVIHTAMGQHFCGRDQLSSAQVWQIAKKMNYKLYYLSFCMMILDNTKGFSFTYLMLWKNKRAETGKLGSESIIFLKSIKI